MIASRYYDTNRSQIHLKDALPHTRALMVLYCHTGETTNLSTDPAQTYRLLSSFPTQLANTLGKRRVLKQTHLVAGGC